MSIVVINHSTTPKAVPIVGPLKAEDEIHLQPGGRVSLPLGWKVSEVFRDSKVESRDTAERKTSGTGVSVSNK